MPELRRDPLTGRVVSYAPERAKRPVEVGETAPRLIDDPARCPFCPGKESMLSPATLLLMRSGSSIRFTSEAGDERIRDWIVKCIPNLYPAFSKEDKLRSDDELRDVRGVHEVLIDTREHDGDPWKLSLDQIYLILLTIRERLKQFEEERELVFASFGKNHGPNSGASLRHPHTHLFATPITPPLIEVEAMKLRKESCLLCDQVEEIPRDRSILATENYLAICPWASREPYEVMIFPKSHLGKFTEMNDQNLYELSSIFSTTMKALKMVLVEPSFNMILHTKPKDIEDFHWHLEIIPRTLMPMVIDVGLEVHVNTIYPEKAAKDLRAAIEKL